MPSLITFFSVILVVNLNTKILCFNLESRDPLVKRGEKGSYFGYSVALHKTLESTSLLEDSWLLVGAPLGQNLQPLTNRSGALFKCPLTSLDNNNQHDCIQVETDGRRSSEFDYDEIIEKKPFVLNPPARDEIKHGQWMGVSVRSQGPAGKVIACAHRYIQSPNLNEHHYGYGLCYSFTNDLEWEEQWEPCKGRPVQLEHQQFGYCQAGTSLALLSDGTALIGSPGPYTWRGTLFVLSVAGDFLHRDKHVYMGPLNDQSQPIDKYSYLGMSAAAGRFFYDKNVSYAAGAPRSRDHGEIFIFNKQQQTTVLNISLVIQGDQFASGFGYEIASVDVNNDGFDDLIVGAPFYFGRTEGGAVYIYYNLRDCKMDNCSYDAKLTGVMESRFGFSITSLGDINRDGYKDIAVGAPYEGGGAIYIYLGSRNGLNLKYSQKIHPEYEGLTTVGYSLSGGLDMDNNGYPDLLSGAYDSDMVLLYRARSIIDIQIDVKGKELRNIDPTKNGCARDRHSNNTCFSFEACFNINSVEAKTSLNTIRVQYHIEAEVFEKKFSRVWFKKDDDLDARKHFLVAFYTIDKNQKRYCRQETAYIKEQNRDILSPIKLRINCTLLTSEPHSPILNQTSVKNFQASFQKACGSDDICQSNMKLNAQLTLEEYEPHSYFLNLASRNLLNMDINIINDGESAYEAQLCIKHPLSLDYAGTGEKPNNINCERHNGTLVSCTLGNPYQSNHSSFIQIQFATQSSVSKESELRFDVFVNSTSEELSNQTSQALVAIIRKKAEIKLTGSGTRFVYYGGERKGEAAMQYFSDIGPSVQHYYVLSNDGPWRIENAVVTIEWPWQVANDKPQGKWLLYLESVPFIKGEQNICWLEDTQQINPLNLTNHPNNIEIAPEHFATGTSVFDETSSDPSTSNETSNDIQSLSHVRKRRYTEVVVKSDTVEKDGKVHKIVTLDCQKHSAKCINIKCNIAKLDKGEEATIQIKSRSWNSTFIEDYNDVNWVQIVSRGFVTVSGIEQINTTDDQTSATTLVLPDSSQFDSEVPIWVYIIAVIVGFLVLLLLIFILWKVGFFKRKRVRDPTLSGNLTKQAEQESLLNK